MRKLHHALLLLGILIMTSGMWSCSDDDNPTNSGLAINVEAPEENALFATSATFKLTTRGVESYVYKVVEGNNATEPDPVVVYAEAQQNGAIVTVTSETSEATVTGLEGNKTYTVFFVFKVGNSYEIRSQIIVTPAYSQMVTVISADMFEIKLHVEVPEDMYYSLSSSSLENYIAFQQQYGREDIDWVIYNGGAYSPRYKGPQTITIAKDANAYEGALNESDYEADFFTYSVVPGTGYVFFVSQCSEDGSTDAYTETVQGDGSNDSGNFRSISNSPNIKEYTEEAPHSESSKFTGKYSKTVLFSKQAAMGEGTVKVAADRLTEKTAQLSFMPSDNIFQYAVVMVDDNNKEDFIYLCGGEDGVQAAVLNYGTMMDGAQQVYYPIEQGHTYTVYVVGVCNEMGTVQTFNTIEGIKPIVSDKPAVELEITALPSSNPYQVGFNIKAPNADCVAFRYLCNYTKEWWPALNGMEGGELESNIANMMASYGQGVNDPEVINAVNSAKGYDIYFSSMDETESWIVMESYNADEKTKLFYEEPGCKVTSAPLEPEAPVNSELFSKLLGNWTATMTQGNGDTSDPVSMPVTIAEGPMQQSSLPGDVKKKLMDYFVESGYSATDAEVAVENYFKEYQERSVYYTKKNRAQNCLVATGFSYDQNFAPFADSWDLFCSTEYSAYSTEELFRDYGPKLYFKIAKNEAGKDSVSVIVTRKDESGNNYLRYVDPVSDWYQATLQFYAFNPETPDNCYITEFPVEISDDMNTITIKPVVQDGITYSPGFAIEYMPGSPMWSFPTTADGIVLKRTSSNTRTQTNSLMDVLPKVKTYSGNHFRRTRAPYGYTPKKAVAGKVFSIETMKKVSKK